MRVAGFLITFVYISAALVTVGVLRAPWWARRDRALAAARAPRSPRNLTVTAAGGFAVVALGGLAFYFLAH